MKLSARNQFKGTVVDIQDGAVNGIVKIDIGGGNIISSVITMASIRELGLKVGGTAYAVTWDEHQANVDQYSEVWEQIDSGASEDVDYVDPENTEGDE